MKFCEVRVMKLTIPISTSIILCCFQRTGKRHHLFLAILSLTDLFNHHDKKEKIQLESKRKNEVFLFWGLNIFNGSYLMFVFIK